MENNCILVPILILVMYSLALVILFIVGFYNKYQIKNLISDIKDIKDKVEPIIKDKEIKEKLDKDIKFLKTASKIDIFMEEWGKEKKKYRRK